MEGLVVGSGQRGGREELLVSRGLPIESAARARRYVLAQIMECVGPSCSTTSSSKKMTGVRRRIFV